MFGRNKEPEPELSTKLAFRHLVNFQIKLAMDALRDLVLSPVSLIVFVVDSVTKPSLEDSLYLKLMRAGRRSDRIINLFDEYTEHGEYTVDSTLSEVEQVIAREVGKERQRAANQKRLSGRGGEPPQ